MSPAPIKTARRKIVFLIGAGLFVAAALLFVVFNIDRPSATHSQPPRIDPQEYTELIPLDLTEQDMAGDGSNLERNPQGMVAQRGHIQTLEDGKLRQYRFDSLDPNPSGKPAGWSKMENPEIEAHLDNNMVLTLKGDSALVHMPTKAPESGTMTGNVVIRLFELQEGQTFDAQTIPPALEVKTNEATFHNVQGEILCDGLVDIQTPTAHVPGEKLRLLINEVDERYWLSMAEAGPIRLSNLDDNASNEAVSQPAATSLDRDKRSKRGQGKRNRSKRQSTSQPALALDESGFYRLTLRNNVRIQQGDGTGWNAHGEELHIIFSMEANTLGQSLAADTMPKKANSWVARSWPETLAALAVAAPATAPVAHETAKSGLYQPSDDEITITCDGGLEMAPLVNAAEKPASVDDMRFELIGRPLRLHHPADAIEVACATLAYQTLNQRLQLAGTTAYPLTIESPEMRAAGDRFWFSRLEHHGGFTGPGWLAKNEQANGSQATSQPEHDRVAAKPPLLSSSSPEFQINWQQSVDLSFEPTNVEHERNEGQLQSAKFNGGVIVLTADFTMNADSMNVDFTSTSSPPDETAQKSSPPKGIRAIDAAGSVRVVSLSDEGSLACTQMHIDFAQHANGKTWPLNMRAAGEVAAIDQQGQTVWSDVLEIAFLPPDETNAGQSADRAAQVDALVATGNVQVLMADGARAFADRLEGEAAAQRSTLTGADVLVISDRAAARRGTTLILDKATRSSLWPGSGEFVYYASSIADATPQRIERPNLDSIDANVNPVQIRASWTESMNFDGSVNEGAGSLMLRGGVSAASAPNALELSTMSGNALTLQFINATKPASQPDVVASNAEQTALSGAHRQLKLFIAEGDAKLESRAWLNADHSDKPRVFYVSGPLVSYDDVTFEASVQGPGELLVRDETPSTPGSAEGSATQPSRPNPSPLTTKGTTSFKWSDHLRMTRRDETLSDVAMAGDVRVIHQAIDKSITTVRARELQASVQRARPNAVEAPAQIAGAFDLGGSMNLKSLRGTGDVYVDSATRDIDCDEFDYNYETGIAKLSALPNHVVTLTTKGNPNPQHARMIVWDMVQDKITVTEASGRR